MSKNMSEAAERMPAPDEYIITVGVKEFSLTRLQLQSDAPSLFTRSLLGEFAESSSRRLRLPSHSPEIFGYIFRHLQGCVILPLDRASCPPQMSLSATLQTLRREAEYFGLEKLSAALAGADVRFSSVEALSNDSPLFGLGMGQYGTMLRVKGISMAISVKGHSESTSTEVAFDLGRTVPRLIAEKLATSPSQVPTTCSFINMQQGSTQPLVIKGFNSTHAMTDFGQLTRIVTAMTSTRWENNNDISAASRTLAKVLFPYFHRGDRSLPGYNLQRDACSPWNPGSWKQEFAVDEAILIFAAPGHSSTQNAPVICATIVAVECSTKAQVSLELLSSWRSF